MKHLKFGVFGLGVLVAIVTAISSLSAQDVRRDGRPSTRIRPAMPDEFSLRASGNQLGVMVSDPSTRQSPQADPGSLRTGVVVDEVHPDSPAEKAGLKAGDVIVEYDGERVRSARQFTRLVQETPEGRTVAIGLMRDGKKQTVNAVPEAGRMTWNFGPEVDRALREVERGMRGFRFDVPAPYFDFRFDERDRGIEPNNREPRRFEYRLPDEFRFPVPGFPFPTSRGRLGVSVQSMTSELAEYFGAKNGGALVSSVTRESAAAKAGIKAGDVIVSVNGKSVSDADDLTRELEDISGDLTIIVLRDKKEMTLQATIERPRPTAPRAGSRPGAIL